MWIEFWNFVYTHFIFHTVIVMAIFFIILFPNRLGRLFGKYKKIKIGQLELQAEEISPDTPCPYIKSREQTFKSLIEVNTKVDSLLKDFEEITKLVKDMSIDQQKSAFYDEDLPEAERLVAGLKYVNQGGNGYTKPEVIAFAEKNKSIYNALISAKSELRIN